ncbi:MAG: Rieske 2Fe-2S domain-containing protein [Betaproteobacteria bacterium]|jgi:nitrite reductase/ring-hydroxylating ferredoxin subunit
MLSAQDNALLVASDAGTMMGEYLRRYWHPVALSDELPDPDCAPLRIRVLGEDLVLFRDSAGRTGLLERACAHRGADLFFGRNEEGGLRCIYHGWKFDRTGACVDMPNVPPGAAYHGRMRIKAYPTNEFAGMVWAYLGPQSAQPERVPQLEAGLVPPSHRFVTKRLVECNWTHSMEGALDTAHFSFLHMPAPARLRDDNPAVAADLARLRWLRNDPMPRFKLIDHDVGFLIGGARTADPGEHYWRLTQFMLPTHSITPSAMPGETLYGYTWTPIDDTRCWVYTYAWHPDRPLDEAERARYAQGGYGQFAELGPGYVPVRNRSNDYLLSRDEQRNVSFTGVRGIAEQDQMAQESQGVVVDRSREHLTATDVAIVHFRRLMLGQARALAAGEAPVAPGLPDAYRVRGGGAHTSDGKPLEDVMIERFGSVTGRIG